MYHDTPLRLIQDDEGVAALVERFSKKSVIAVDTESDSMYHYQEKVCLLQFSDDEGDVIVDPLGIRDMAPLGEIIANAAIVKIFHGADYDVHCLRRDYGWQINNMFDTQIAARLVGIQRIGLADLLDLTFGVPIDKTLQKYDWSRRPLLDEHIDYARGDTHFLLALRRVLLRKVRVLHRERHLVEECRRLTRKRMTVRGFSPNDYNRVKGSSRLDDTALKVLRRLYILRDSLARSHDRPPYKVLADPVLLQLATYRPTSTGELLGGRGRTHYMKKRYASQIVQAIVDGLDDPNDVLVVSPPKDAQARATPDQARLHGRAAERVLDGLKTWRNALCEHHDLLDTYTTFSNQDLLSIARRRPASLSELGAIPKIRDWQVRDHGEAILAELDKLAPMASLKPATPSRKRS